MLKKSAMFVIMLMLFVVGGLFLSTTGFQTILHDTFEFIGSASVCKTCYFVAFYALGTILMFPGGVMTLAAGMLFGPWLGALFALFGALIGSCGALLLSRYWLGERLRKNRIISKHLGIADRLAKRSGFVMVLLLRLSPLVPFNLLNYLLGLTKVSLAQAMGGSAIGMLPGALLYSFMGSMISSIAGLFATNLPAPSLARLALLVLGGGATLLVTVLISRSVRAELSASQL